MNASSKINSNYGNNDNCDVLINIPEVKLRPERGKLNGNRSDYGNNGFESSLIKSRADSRFYVCIQV